jgi:hypothetical protein
MNMLGIRREHIENSKEMHTFFYPDDDYRRTYVLRIITL